MQALYGSWRAGTTDIALLYCAASGTRRHIATHMLVNLFLERGRLESKYIERRKAITSLGALRRFAASQRLPDLKRMMHQNLCRERVCLVLDHLDHPDPRVASLLEVWLESMPLILVARDADSVGRGRWLLSSMEHVALAPLDRATLLRMAGTFPSTRQLEQSDLREAVARAAGNPGRLCELLRAAVRHEYRRSGTVQWKLLELDLRIQAIGAGSQRRARGAA